MKVRYTLALATVALAACGGSPRITVDHTKVTPDPLPACRVEVYDDMTTDWICNAGATPPRVGAWPVVLEHADGTYQGAK